MVVGGVGGSGLAVVVVIVVGGGGGGFWGEGEVVGGCGLGGGMC